MEVAIILLTLALGLFLLWLFTATGSGKSKVSDTGRTKLSKDLLEEYQKMLEKDDRLIPPPQPGDEDEFDSSTTGSEDSGHFELEREATELQPALCDGLRDTPLKRWTVGQVALFLEALGMEDYVQNFVKANINGASLWFEKETVPQRGCSVVIPCRPLLSFNVDAFPRLAGEKLLIFADNPKEFLKLGVRSSLGGARAEPSS